MNTHLDLGRLEGRDGAGEGGGNAGHFFGGCVVVVCVKRVLEVATMRARNSFCIEIRIPTIPNSEPRPLELG